RNPAVVEAFRAVPREHFFGPGPWRLITPRFLGTDYVTPDAEPHWLYHDVLVSLDASRRLNSGQPSLWAALLDQLDLRPGERVLQVGSGVGYYSAVLAELVGRAGRVVALEHDAELAARTK